MAQRVAGEQYESITGQLFEIGRQLRQTNGYPYDPAALKKHLQDAIEGRFQLVSSPVVKAIEQLLEEMARITITIDPAVDFRHVLKTTTRTDTTEALSIQDAFAGILAKAKRSALTSVSLKPRRLKRNALDCEIKAELPKDHELDPTIFCAVLATELRKVMRREHSDVFSKERWCLFYVACSVISVFWNPDRLRWCVYVWKFNESQWHAECVVFSFN